MDQGTWDALVGWIGTHPVAAGGVVFLLAFCDAIVVLGIVVPLAALFLAIGALMGLGALHPGYTILSAAAGAFCGDLVGYLVGRRYGQGLRRIWPFSRHPGWLDSGEAFMRRHGRKGIVIGRYVGAVRPFVPAIVGMAGLPFSRYAWASVAACATWAVLYLAPGWLFGASFELLRAVGGRLAVVALGLLLACLAVAWLVSRLHRLLAPRAGAAAESLLAWSRRHPVWGRLAAPLVDPNLPESPSVAAWAAMLLAAGLCWAGLTGLMGTGVEPLGFDLQVHQDFGVLRTPLVDPLLAVLTMPGDRAVWLPSTLVLAVFLLWRRRGTAALHWIGVVGAGWCASALLNLSFAQPGPHPESTGFPIEPVAMTTIVSGFFAILIARELPGRNRDWPYVLAAVWVGAVVVARLYFGVDWASDALGSVLFGLSWIAVFGIAYRRRRTRPFWIAPPAALFLAAACCIVAWRATDWPVRLNQLSYQQPAESLTASAWKQGAWASWARRRADGGGSSAWPLDVEFAGPLDFLLESMQREGWRPVYPIGWRGILLGLRADLPDAHLPWLDAPHQGRRTALILARANGTSGLEETIHLWPTHVEIVDVGPLWVGARGHMAPTRLTPWFRYRARVGTNRNPEPDWPAALHAESRSTESGPLVWLLEPATPGSGQRSGAGRPPDAQPPER